MVKARKLIAALMLAGSANAAFSQDPPASFPVPAPAAEEPIEIYYGTRRITPEPVPAAEANAVVPASATEAKTQLVNAFLDAMAGVRDGTREITAATVGLLGKVGDRVKSTADTRPIIITTYAPPAPVAAIPAAAPPQVVVVREQAETRPAVEAPASVRLDTLLLGGLGVLAIGVAAWAGLRRTRSAMPLAPLAPLPIPLDPNCVALQGKFNAGPRRDAAEKFELGPTFHEEKHQQELVVEANNTAAVEFILNQNLELLAALNPGSEGETVQTDGEGFAAPALA